MNLQEFRSIIQAQMPYDTGFMFLAGARYYDTAHFQLAVYDTERVPYIIFNEEGTKYSTKNKGFISQKTVGALNRYALGGDKRVLSRYEEYNNRRGSLNMIRQGALDKVAGEPNWIGDTTRMRGLR
jgi:hypothetical protein